MTLGEALETVPIEDDISLLVMEYANMVRALKIISNTYIQQQSEINRLQKENKQLKSGRETIIVQAEAIEFKAKKNAEAYKRLKCELNSVNAIFSEVNKQNKQLKELLRLAVEDMSIGWLCAVCSKRTKGKEWAMCQYQVFASAFDEERTVTCANFEWRHTDKLKGLIEL